MSSTTPVRPDMVKRAVIFLRHPKVKGAPQEKQMAFLKDKSLTQPVRIGVGVGDQGWSWFRDGVHQYVVAVAAGILYVRVRNLESRRYFVTRV